MPQSKKSFLVSYLLLVGLPLLGMLGILEAGRSLTAPVWVGGDWDLQANSSDTRAQRCAGWLGSTRPITLHITQSGRYLTLTLSSLRNVALPASLDGTTLATDAASATSSEIKDACAGAAGISVKATVDPKAEPSTLSGTLSANGCPSCGSVSFRAVRQRLSAGKRGE